MYGDLATKLIRHIHRERGDFIPPYEYQLIANIMKENEELYAENVRTSQSATTRGEPLTEHVREKDDIEDGDNRKKCESPSDTSRTPVDNSNQQDDVDISEKEIMIMQVRHTAKLYNKRCIIAYHYERLNRLKRLRWEYGNNLPKEIVQNLTNDELEWFTKYNDNLFSYMSSLNDGQGIDLTLYTCPPKKLNVVLKCIKDYGQFDLGDGEHILLKKDNIYHLPLSQCEKLIHQGVLEYIKT